MKTSAMWAPVLGPRGGVTVRGSVTVTSDAGDTGLHVMVDAVHGQKWGAGHDQLLQELAAALGATAVKKATAGPKAPEDLSGRAEWFKKRHGS